MKQRADGATYSYDADGNVASILGGGSNRHFTFDSANRLKCVDATTAGGCGMAEFRYDVDGRKVVSGDPWEFGYTVFVADGLRIDRSIDISTQIEIHAFGERIALKQSSEWLRTAETPFALPLEIPLAGALLALAGLLAWATRNDAWILVVRRPGYAGVASLLVVVLVLGPAAQLARATGRTSVITWELTDRLGTGMVMVDETGARLVHRSFTPFGQQDEVAGSATWLPVNYGSHLYDADAGLYAMEARWYDAKGGTFLSVDPLVADAADPQSFNAYAYARSNPVSYFDPTGMAGCFLFVCWENMGDGRYQLSWNEYTGAWPDVGGYGDLPGVTIGEGPMGLDAAGQIPGPPPAGGSAPREPSTVTIGTGGGEIEFGRTSEGRGHYTVTAVLWGVSGGVSVSGSNPPGFKQARAAVRGAAAVITLSVVARGPSVRVGPVGAESGGNAGVNIVMTSNGRIVPVFFAEGGGGLDVNRTPATGFQFSGFTGIEVGGFRLGPSQ